MKIETEAMIESSSVVDGRVLIRTD
jgi:hypothetical protein